MANKCKFKFYSQSGKECVYPPSIGSDFCIWHDPEVKKDEEFVRIRLKSAIKETGGDLEGFLLRKADLSGMDLREVDLRDADLREADLEDSDCSRADFRGAKLNRVYAAGANFDGANFMAANLSDGNFVNANFQNCNLRIVNLGHADVRGGDFTGSDVRNTDFSQTEQNDATNFTGVTGITAKIILAQPQSEPEVAPGPTMEPQMEQPLFDQVGEDTFIPSAPDQAPPLFGTDDQGPAIFEADQQVPASSAFQASDQESADSLFGSNAGEDVVNAFSDFGQPGSDFNVPVPPQNDAPVPGTGAVQASRLPAEQAPSTSSVPVAQAGSALEAGSAAFKTAVTSIGSKAPSEDETDFRLDAVNEDALTSRYSGKKGGFMKKLIIAVVVLAVLGAGGYFGLKMMKSSQGNGGGKVKPSTGEASAKLKTENQKLIKELSGKEAEIKKINALLADKEKEISGLNKRINDLSAAASAGNDEKIKALEQEKSIVQKKLADLEIKYKKVSDTNDIRMEKLLEIAAKSSDLKDKNDELVANNKKLQQSQKDLQDRIKEAEEILKEYKKRLAEAEKSLEEGKSAAPAVDDPVIRAHPGLEPMPWDEYRIFSPKETSYLVGLKFSKGEFINMSILILGEAASSKPNFRITFRDKDGNELEKKYRIDLSKRGIKFQQVLMKNQGWLVKDQPPVYILVEFY